MTSFSIDETLGGTVMSDLTINGLDDTKLTLAGGTTTTLAGENTVHSDATITLEPVTTTSTVNLEPVTTTSTVNLEPVTTNSTVDLKPVAVDTCVRLELAPLPPTEYHAPYDQRWAFSLFGQELMALAVRGRGSVEVRPAPRRPAVFGLDEMGRRGDCDCGCAGAGSRRADPIVIEL